MDKLKKPETLKFYFNLNYQCTKHILNLRDVKTSTPSIKITPGINSQHVCHCARHELWPHNQPQ